MAETFTLTNPPAALSGGAWTLVGDALLLRLRHGIEVTFQERNEKGASRVDRAADAGARLC